MRIARFAADRTDWTLAFDTEVAGTSHPTADGPLPLSRVQPVQIDLFERAEPDPRLTFEELTSSAGTGRARRMRQRRAGATTPADPEAMARELETSGRYRILRQL